VSHGVVGAGLGGGAVGEVDLGQMAERVVSDRGGLPGRLGQLRDLVGRVIVSGVRQAVHAHAGRQAIGVVRQAPAPSVGVSLGERVAVGVIGIVHDMAVGVNQLYAVTGGIVVGVRDVSKRVCNHGGITGRVA